MLGPVIKATRISADRDVVVKASRGLWYLGCLTMPMLAVRVGPATVSDLLFASAALILSLAVIRYRGTTRLSWPLAAGLTIAAALITMGHAASASESLAVAGRMIFLFVIWRWQGRSVVGTTEHLRRSLVAYVTGAALSAAVGALQAGAGITVFNLELSGSTFARAPGLAGHVNDQGGQLAVAVCLGLGLYLHEQHRSRRLAALIIACVVGLVLSGSVTGMLAMTAGALFMLVRRGISFSVLARLTASIAVVLWLTTQLQSRFSDADPISRLLSSTGNAGGISTLHLRVLTDQFAWAHIQEHPWGGVGLDPASGGTYNGLTQTHNIFLLFWFQGGALFLAALLIALIAVAPLALHRSRPFEATQEAIAGGFLAALVFAQTAPIVYQRYFWFPALLAVILADQRSRAASLQTHEVTPVSKQAATTR